MTAPKFCDRCLKTHPRCASPVCPKCGHNSLVLSEDRRMIVCSTSFCAHHTVAPREAHAHEVAAHA